MDGHYLNIVPIDASNKIPRKDQTSSKGLPAERDGRKSQDLLLRFWNGGGAIGGAIPTCIAIKEKGDTVDTVGCVSTASQWEGSGIQRGL